MALDLRCVRVQHFRMTELLIAKFRRIDVLKYEMTKKKEKGQTARWSQKRISRQGTPAVRMRDIDIPRATHSSTA